MELLCSAAFCLFQESILSRNCSSLQHLVFSRNPPIQELVCYAESRLFQEYFYPGTTLLCSILCFPGIYIIQELLRSCIILSFPGIYSIQELLCSASSCLFRNLFHPGTTLLCSILSVPEIYSIHDSGTALLCSILSHFLRYVKYR